MRITKEQAATNRERVIAEASKLFRQRGFEGVGVAELMRAAGLTHGGFYNHFDSKEAIESEACARIFQKSVDRVKAIAGMPDPAARAAAFAEYRARYLSTEARDAPAAACPMVAFAGDVSRQSGPVREAFAEGLAAYLDAFERSGAGGRDRAAAIREFCLMAGALTLARSVATADPDLSDEILRAAKG